MSKEKKEPLKLTSPTPINKGLRELNPGYFILGGGAFIIGLIGGVGDVGSGVMLALIALFFWWVVKANVARFKRSSLRYEQFYLHNKISSEEIIAGLIPLLMPYGMMAERGTEHEPVVVHKNYSYDIIVNENGTFTIWWRKSLVTAMFEMRYITSYRKIVIDMGVIAYHIQQLDSCAKIKPKESLY